jgi:UPF0755 protein
MAIKQMHKRKIDPGKRLFRFFILTSLIVGLGAYFLYTIHKKVYAPNVEIAENESASLYIPTGSTYNEVVGLLEISGYIKNQDHFKWVAEKKSFPGNVKPGHYVLHDGMNNNELVNMLRGGMQTPVRLTFSNVRTKSQLAGIVAQKIEVDSAMLLDALNDSILLKDFGFSPNTVFAMILPNTYEIWWNTDSQGFLKRMHREYEKFWNTERLELAQSVGLNPVEVATLASIVDEETIKEDEKARVAGVYVNRLNKGIKLQACPTIKFAMDDFTIQRILTSYLTIDSPYNTYMHKGLPPGPIRLPSISGINAVLNYEDHNYIYMVAKDDFSGYHNFAKTLRQHNIYAAKYRRALSKRQIFR